MVATPVRRPLPGNQIPANNGPEIGGHARGRFPEIHAGGELTGAGEGVVAGGVVEVLPGEAG